MGLTVFAEKMGFFHKGSGGTGLAPGDVCLSPPPPPAGPVPVPYVNSLSAADLTKGSKSVKIDGEPTALEDQSEISTSTGDEAGTQGGNVVTHKTKGKGSFMLWSFTVKVEGKGVGRNGDPLAQNCASLPAGIIAPAAKTTLKAKGWTGAKRCTKPYKRPKEGKPNKKQKDAIKKKKCWKCKKRMAKIPDHQPPLITAWYMGGCNDVTEFKKWAKSVEATPKGHCRKCSGSQGGHLRGKRGTKAMKTLMSRVK